jgi:hypothetical protein
MSDNLLNLIRKLKELADRGEGGEKENAGVKLQQLLDKHGISIEDIEKDVVKERIFNITPNQQTFFRQVVASCFGEKAIYQYQKEPKKKVLVRILKLTDAEFIEFSSKFDFYWNKYESDLKTFYSAFIQKNHLYRKNSGTNKEELTQEQLDEISRVREMMLALKRHSFHKEIENTK